jgi:3-hydroxyisobutyrate dehydrogenase-like beta-hydroxyacid dehydrogenase
MSSTRIETVGFIGLGMMGSPMAENILKAGFPLVVHDIDPQRGEYLVGLGAEAASNAAEVARRASRVVIMVDTTTHLQEAVMASGGLFEGLQTDDAIICMSTIDPLSLKVLFGRLEPHGIHLIDAPVSGLQSGARLGTLKATVGGTTEAVERCRPVLEAMTSEIIHMGSIGQGTVMKLVNNMLCQVSWASIAEALVLGTKAGLDPTQMVDVILSTTGNSVAFEYAAPRILARDFEGIRMEIHSKDMELMSPNRSTRWGGLPDSAAKTAAAQSLRFSSKWRASPFLVATSSKSRPGEP